MPDFSRYTLTPENQTYLDSILRQPAPVSAWSTKTGGPVTPRSRDAVALGEAERFDRNNRSMANHNRLVRFGQYASIAPFAVAGGAALAGGAAASGGGAAGGVGAGVATGVPAGGSVAATAPWWQAAISPAIGAGVSTFGNIYAARQQNAANKLALAASDKANAEAMALEREQMAEAKRQWDVMQKFEADRYAASEDERLYDRRLRDEREARLAPRRALAADALQRIPGILASGRTSPGLRSLGSYRRG